MQKRTREIIALVLLIVLGACGIGAAAWYITVGHNWNATATNIDDRIGTMEGYTVILCEGSVPSIADQQQVSLAQPMLEQQNFGETDEDDMPETTIPLTLDVAINSYLEKDAQIVKVFCDDPAYYADPIIVPRNGNRLAIFSAEGTTPGIAIKAAVRALDKVNVDFKICLTSDIEPVKDALEGVDMVICTGYDEAGKEGRYVDSTYVVGSPYEGYVGAVIMAPSGYLSSKMINVA